MKSAEYVLGYRTDNPLSHRYRDLHKALGGTSQDASYLPGENNFLETLLKERIIFSNKNNLPKKPYIKMLTMSSIRGHLMVTTQLRQSGK